MKISERKLNDITILDVEGVICWPDDSRNLKEYIVRLVDTHRSKILINLAGVHYIDSSALGELISLHIKIRRSIYGDLKILNPAKMITDLLTVTKLITVFEVFDDEAAGVKSFELPRRREVAYRAWAIGPCA